jgi:hypothetical protein
MAKYAPKIKPKRAIPVTDPLKRAVALGAEEIRKGVSDAQIGLTLEDAGINIKKLPPDFLRKLRSGDSFKPKPPKPIRPAVATDKTIKGTFARKGR